MLPLAGILSSDQPPTFSSRIAASCEGRAQERNVSALWSAFEAPCPRIIHVTPQTHKLCHTSAIDISFPVRTLSIHFCTHCLILSSISAILRACVSRSCKLRSSDYRLFVTMEAARNITASMAVLTATSLDAAGSGVMPPEGPRRVTEVRRRVVIMEWGPC